MWGIARALGGRVLLRIEDHDRIRSRPEYELAFLEDLDWLGFEPDDGRRAVAQAERHAGSIERRSNALQRVTHVYACDCSRKDIGGERYDGRCRDRGLEPGSGRGMRVQLA